MKTVTRVEYAQMKDTEWRFECPNGHTRLSLLQEPGWYWKTFKQQERELRHANTTSYSGMFRCQSCESTHHRVWDKKNEEWVTILPPEEPEGTARNG